LGCSKRWIYDFILAKARGRQVFITLFVVSKWLRSPISFGAGYGLTAGAGIGRRPFRAYLSRRTRSENGSVTIALAVVLLASA
jgi:hypothetical protein